MRGVGRAHGSGHIHEDAVAVVAPEVVRPYAVGHIQVEVAVAIVIEPRRTGANPEVREGRDCMGDVAQGRNGHVGEEGLGLAGLSGEAGPPQQQDTDVSGSGAHHDSLYCF